jgi:hypothetical protein
MRFPRPFLGFLLELLAWIGVFAAGETLRFGWSFMNLDWGVAIIFGTSVTYLRRYRNSR